MKITNNISVGFLTKEKYFLILKGKLFFFFFFLRLVHVILEVDWRVYEFN